MSERCCIQLMFRVHSVLEKSLIMLEFILKKKIQGPWSAWNSVEIRCLKVLEKSLNLNIHYDEILHLITVLNQTHVCISTVLAFSSLAYLTNSHSNLSPAFIITVLLSTIQYTSVSRCSLTSYFLPILLSSIPSCFYSKRSRHWMAFYVLMCH